VKDNTQYCYSGWHVPINEIWLEIIGVSGGIEITGGKLKESDTTRWQNPNTGDCHSWVCERLGVKFLLPLRPLSRIQEAAAFPRIFIKAIIDRIKT